ncbi:ABC transporter permease [Thermogladius sp. 4427co]|uniref:ABC transporter permease n=1 Tax=Thermogladius sp. 4427co TaxID=3450718 RepID=UPI003F79BEA4
MRNGVNKFIEGVRIVISNRKGLVGLILLSIPLAMAIAPQLIAPYNPWETVDKPFLPPSFNHLLGTNDVGQDIFSELVYGSRISLLVGFAAALSAVVLGTLIGLLAGYFGGVIDDILSTITDVMLLLPVLPFMILMAAILGQGYQNIILTIAVFTWPGIARLVKAQVVSLKNSLYIEAAKAYGAGSWRILRTHILPQIYPLLVAFVILRIGGAIIAEASLSYLGLGDPTQKSWGSIIFWAVNSGAISSGKWWWIVAPGLMITITVEATALIGYAIEEYVNPRLRKS